MTIGVVSVLVLGLGVLPEPEPEPELGVLPEPGFNVVLEVPGGGRVVVVVGGGALYHLTCPHLDVTGILPEYRSTPENRQRIFVRKCKIDQTSLT